MEGDIDAQREAQELSAALFSTRRPKHIGSGLASGAKSLAKGVLAGRRRCRRRRRRHSTAAVPACLPTLATCRLPAGAVGLVAAPVIGAYQEGVKGAAKGAAAGARAAPNAGGLAAPPPHGRLGGCCLLHAQLQQKDHQPQRHSYPVLQASQARCCCRPPAWRWEWRRCGRGSAVGAPGSA